MITLDNISKKYGDLLLFKNLSLKLTTGKKNIDTRSQWFR